MRNQLVSHRNTLLIFGLLFAVFIIISPRSIAYLYSDMAMVNWAKQKMNPTDEKLSTGTFTPNLPWPTSVAMSLGRISLSNGYAQEALAFFEQAGLKNLSRNQLALMDYIVALSQIGRFDDAVTRHQEYADFLGEHPATQDAILVAYLHQLQQKPDSAEFVFANIDKLQVDNLYVEALKSLQIERVTSLTKLSDSSQLRLAHFPIQAILPTDERLLTYLIDLVPEMLESGIWDAETTERVLRLWVWQYPHNVALGSLIETRANQQTELPIDWVSLSRELTLRQTPSQMPPAIASDDPNNVLPQGSFDTIDASGFVGWREADYITGDNHQMPLAGFFMGADALITDNSPYSLRLDGIWMNDIQSGFYGTVAAKNNNSYMIDIEPNIVYRLSGYYRTNSDMEHVSIYMGRPTMRLIDTTLPPTSQSWQSFSLTACHTKLQIMSMQLLLRLYGTGTVWFDSITLTPVSGLTCPR